MAGQRARTVVALGEIRVGAIVERDRGDVEQAIAVVRERHGGGRRRTIERLVDHDRRRTECDEGRRGFTLEGDQLLAPHGIVGNHDAADVGAEGGARLERDLEGTGRPGLESRLGAGVLEGIEVEVVPVRTEINGPHDQQPTSGAGHSDALRLAAPGQVRRIEVHLGPLDPGLRDAEPADPAVEAIGHEHRARVGEHAETTWSVDFGRIGRAGVTLESGASDAAQSRDRLAGDVDAADAVIQVVGDIDVALINRGAPGSVEVGLRHTAVAEARRPIPGDRLDHVGRLRIGAHRADPPDPVVEAVGDVESRG